MLSMFENAFSWSNTKYVDGEVKSERILGRMVYYTGKLQGVNFVGVLKSDTSSDKPSIYKLYVGIAKQHPADIKYDKDLGEEVAMCNALSHPIIKMEVDRNFDDVDFRKMITKYYESNVHKNLKFVKTRQEAICHCDFRYNCAS